MIQEMKYTDANGKEWDIFYRISSCMRRFKGIRLITDNEGKQINPAILKDEVRKIVKAVTDHWKESLLQRIIA